MRKQIVDAYVKHVCAYKCNADVLKANSYSDHDPCVVEINLGKYQGIDNVREETIPARKELRNGQLFIIRGDQTYSITGVLVH